KRLDLAFYLRGESLRRCLARMASPECLDIAPQRLVVIRPPRGRRKSEVTDHLVPGADGRLAIRGLVAHGRILGGEKLGAFTRRVRPEPAQLRHGEMPAGAKEVAPRHEPGIEPHGEDRALRP